MVDFTTDEGRGKVRCCCWVGCCFGWLLFLIVLLSISLKTVDQGEFAFIFDHYKQDIVGEPIMDPGVKWVGPLNSLVRYPSVNQVVYFTTTTGQLGKGEVRYPPIYSRTYDGLYVYVQVSFQWALEAQNLKSIFKILGGAEDLINRERNPDKPSFEAAIVRFARSALADVCSEYTAAQFFANQSLVEQKMYDDLKDIFNQPANNLVLTIRGLQLRSVGLPSAYEDSITETQKQQQDYLTALAERDTKLMQYSTLQMQNVELQKQQLVNTNAQAEALMQSNAAWVQQYTNFQALQARSYTQILRNLENTTDRKSVV